jgi:YD repeat-containing protein
MVNSRSGFTGTFTYDDDGNRLTRTVNGVFETYACDAGESYSRFRWEAR